MNLVLACLGLIIVLQEPVNGWRRRRRRAPPARDCKPAGWSGWSSCTHQCSNSGTQTRTREKSVVECCGGRCNIDFTETRACNRDACHGGTPTNTGCNCNTGWTGTCCDKDVDECLQRPCEHTCHNVPGSYICSCDRCHIKVSTRCELRQCSIGGVCYTYGKVNPGDQCQDCQKSRETTWTNNNALSCNDGNLCTRNDRCVDGTCKGTPFTCRSCESCNGNGCNKETCHNGGTPTNTGCDCKPGWTGTCCEKDVDECLQRPCQHTCHNVPGSYTCSCDRCYTKVGYSCELRQCSIDGGCYLYGKVNPGNQCQECQKSQETVWTNIKDLPCNDGNRCTKNDHCVNGVCRGIPVLPCRSCESFKPLLLVSLFCPLALLLSFF